MKILSIQAHFYPVIGGIEIYTLQLFKYLTRWHHEVTIYTTNKLSKEDVFSLSVSPPFFIVPEERDNLLEEEIVENCLVKRFEWKLRFWSFNWVPQLFKEIKYNACNYDIIHAQGYHLFSSVVSCYYAKKFKKPFVLTAYDIIISNDFPLGARIFKFIYDGTLGKYLLKNATRLIALTEAQIPQYIDRGASNEKIKVIPVGIELSSYLNYHEENIANSHYQVDDSIRFILYVGRIEKYKGIQDVIEILPRLLQEQPHMKFVIAGKDYGYKKDLMELAEELNVNDNVIFASNVSNNEKIYLYNKAKLFIFPSKMESFGIVLLEAMASNTLCIAYSIPTLRAIIINKENGILVNDKDELLDKISYYLNNIGEREKIQQNARAFVARFDEEKIANELLDIYEEISQ